MPEPTLTSLLTRIEILERHVERLEQAATITRRKYNNFADAAADIRRSSDPSQTHAAEDDPDLATTVARCLYDTAV